MPRPRPVFVLLCALAGPSSAQVIQGIGVLPGHIASRSECISADGSTAGGDSTGTLSDAVRWNGPLVAVPAPASVLAMITYGLNGDGSAAAGYAIDAFSDQHAWHWEAVGGAQLLPWPSGFLLCVGNDIDVAGSTVVGTCDDGTGIRGTRWTQSGPLFTAQVLTGLPATCVWSDAIAVSNDAAYVVGSLDASPTFLGTRAYRWEAASSLTLTSPLLPGGTFVAAFGMSGNGDHVVGWAQTPTGNHAFRWTPDGNLMLDLGTASGHPDSLAYDASFDGSVVVGFSAPPLPGLSVAMLWTSSLGMLDLNVYLPTIGVSTTDWYLRICDGISDDGRTLTGTGAHEYAPNQFRTEGWILHVPNAPWVSLPVVSSCPAGPNSTGLVATLDVLGSSSVSQNSFTLVTSGGVPGRRHVYFYGPQAAELPFGDGLLCVGGGGTGVFRLATTPYAPDGTGSRRLDFTLPPAGAGPGRIQPGSVWYFQDYYRDPIGPGGTGFNLSNGIQVTFGP